MTSLIQYLNWICMGIYNGSLYCKYRTKSNSNIICIYMYLHVSLHAHQFCITQHPEGNKVDPLANSAALLLSETAELESQSFLCWKLNQISYFWISDGIFHPINTATIGHDWPITFNIHPSPCCRTVEFFRSLRTVKIVEFIKGKVWNTGIP